MAGALRLALLVHHLLEAGKPPSVSDGIDLSLLVNDALEWWWWWWWWFSRLRPPHERFFILVLLFQWWLSCL